MKKEMYTCEWLSGGLVFGFEKLHVGCISHHDYGGFYKISDFEGGELPIDKILETKREILERNNSGDVHPSCKGCALLQKQPVEHKEYPIDVLNFSNFTFCNLKCNYCYLQLFGDNKEERYPSGSNPKALLPTLKSMIEKKQLSPNTVIYWGGGEPVLLKEFDDIIDITLNHGVYNHLNTNATVFSEKLYNALAKNKACVQVSIDAGTPETFKAIKERDLFDDVWTNIAKYAKSGGNIVAKYIVVNENSNEKDIANFVRLAKKYQIKSVVFDISANDKENLSDKRFTTLQFAINEAKKQKVQVSFGSCGWLSAPDAKFERLRSLCQND